MNTFQLFFGMNIPSGGQVSDQEWSSFVSLVVATRFNAFTVQDATGFWKGSQEPTKIVTISTDDRSRINEVCETFKALFTQDAVGIQVLPSMTFV